MYQVHYVLTPSFCLVSSFSSTVELSKLTELNDSADGYDWAWQKDAKILQEKTQAAEGIVAANEEDRDAKAALKLSMDNILMVSYFYYWCRLLPYAPLKGNRRVAIEVLVHV